MAELVSSASCGSRWPQCERRHGLAPRNTDPFNCRRERGRPQPWAPGQVSKTFHEESLLLSPRTAQAQEGGLPAQTRGRHDPGRLVHLLVVLMTSRLLETLELLKELKGPIVDGGRGGGEAEVTTGALVADRPTPWEPPLLQLQSSKEGRRFSKTGVRVPST